MAQKKSKARFKKNNLVKPNAKWLNNAMKSIGEVSLSAFKEMAPTISGTASEVGSTVKDLRSFVSKSRSQGSKVLSDNKYIKVAKNTVKYAFEDLKSGNFNNTEREDEAMMKAMGMDMSDMDMSGFDDSYSDEDASVTFNYIDEGSSVSNNASLEIRESINHSTEANLKASQATIDAMVSIAGTGLLQSQQLGNEVIGHLSNIENTLTSMLEYQQENTTNFYEATLAFMEKMGPSSDEEEYNNNKRISANDVISSKGGLDIATYKRYVKQQLKDYAGTAGDGIAQAVGMLADNTDVIEAMLANPLGAAGKMIIQGLTPSLIKGTIENVEETFKDFMPTMMSKLRNWRNSEETGFIGTIKQALGSIFGIDLDKTNSFDLSGKVTKEKATFDGVVRNSIVEVIPKYLRESTAYLKAIAEHYKIDTKKALNNAEIYDVETNSYISRKKIRKNIANRLEDARVGEISYSDFGKAVESGGGALEQKDADAYAKLTKQLFSFIARNNNNLSPEDINFDDKSSEFSKMFSKLDVKGRHEKRAYDVLKNTLKIMREQNLSTGSLAKAQIVAKGSFGNLVRQMSEDYDMENLLAAGISEDTDINDFIDQELGYTKLKELSSRRKKSAKRKKKKEERRAELDTYRPEYIIKSGSELAREGLINRDILPDTRTSSGRRVYQLQNAESNGVMTAFANAGNHMKASMYALMNGDSKGAIQEIGNIFGDSMKGLWKSFKKNFISPITKSFFGEKNADGFREGGLLAGSQNKIKDTWHAINMRITGKAYKDSSGKLHTKESDGVTSSVDIVKNTMKEVGESIRYRLFGDKDKDKDNEGGKKKSGVVTNLVSSLKEGLNGWKTALFGESEKDTEEAIKDIKKKAMDSIPDATAGAIGGAIVGGVAGSSLLGTLIGGPVGGAVIGFGASFLKKSKTFQDYVFGPEVTDENGNKHRVGGLVSRSTQEMFKDPAIKKSVVGGAAIGAIKSLVLGSSGGLMGALVGGPIAGAAVGAGIGLIRKSEMFHTFLFGDEKKGKTGLIQHFKNVFKGNKDDKDEKDNTLLRKKLGMGAIGAVGGGITAALVGKVGLLGAMLTPAGPVGGAVMGLALGMKASSKRFTRALFGEKDEETGKRKGGLIQKIGNFMHVEILRPMKGLFSEIATDLKTTIQYKILDTIRISVEPIGKAIKGTIGKITDKAKNVISDAGTAVKENLLKPFMAVLSNVLAPVRKAGALVAKLATKAAKSIITFPFKMMRLAANIITSPFRKMASAVNKYFVKPLIKKGKKLIGGLFKRLFSIVSAPFKVLAAVTSFAREKAGDKFARLGRTLGIGDYSDNGTYRSERRRSDREYRDQKRINKQKAREERNLDKNRRKMAKVMDYSEKYFTKETMQMAQKKWLEQGHKKPLKFLGGKNITFDKDPEQVAKEEQKAANAKREQILKKSNAELIHGDGADDGADVEVRTLRENSKQTLLLDAIVNLLGGSSPLGRWSPFKQRQDERRRAQRDLQRNKEAAENGEATPNTEAEGGSEESTIPDYQRWAEEMLEAGGIGKWAKNKLKDKFGRRRHTVDFDTYAEELERRYLHPNNEEASESTDEENERVGSKIKNFFGKFGRRRAKGGPVEKGKAYLVGDGGRDSSAMEIFNPRSNGRILSQGESGLKVFVQGISSKVTDKLSNLFGGKKSKKKNKIIDTPDTEEINTTDASLDFKSSGRQIGDITQYDKATQKSILRNMKKRGVSTEGLIDRDAIAVAKSIRRHNDKEAKRNASLERNEQNKKGSFAAVRAAKQAAEKEAERDATLKDIATNTGETAETSKKSLKEWLKTFGKGGVIALAITALLPVIKKIWDVVGSGVIGQAKALIKDIKFGIENLQNGLSPLGVIGKKIKKIADILTNPADIVDNIKKAFFSENEDGEAQTDHETGAKVNYVRSRVKKHVKRFKNLKKMYVKGRDILSGGKYSEKKAAKKAAKELAKKEKKDAVKLAKEAARNKKWATTVGKRAEGKGVKNFAKRMFNKHASDGVKDAVLNGRIRAASGGDEVLEKQIRKSIARNNAKKGATEVAEEAVRGGKVKTVFKTGAAKLKDFGSKGMNSLKSKVVKNSTEAAVEGANKGLVGKCIDLFKSAISKILEKLSEVASKYSAKKGAQQAAKNSLNKGSKSLISKAVGVITKKFPKISAKIAAIFASDGALAAATAGIGNVIKEAAFAGIYSVNEMSNPRNLFHLDPSTKPDALMYAIAGGVGFLKGTTPGAVVDICCALIASVIGVDFIHEISCLAYRIIMGALGNQTKIDDMEKSQNKLKRNYKAYKQKQDTKNFKQYNNLMKVSGKKEISYKEYQKKLKNGDIKGAQVDSFIDYNHKQNKTIGAKLADKTLSFGSKVKKAVDKIWGKNTTGYFDQDSRIFYIPKGENIYEIYKPKVDDPNLSMKSLFSSMKNFVYKGDIQKDNVPNKDKLKKVTIENTGVKTVVTSIGDKITGIAKSIGKGATKTAKVALTGVSQVNNGIKEIRKGNVLKGIGYIAKTPLYYGAEAIGAVANGVKNRVEGFAKGVTDTASKLYDFGTNVGKTAKSFFISEKTEVLRNPKTNTYWKFDHKTSKYNEYNMNGDKISRKPLDGNAISLLLKRGELVRDKITTNEAGIIKLKNKFLKGVGTLGKNIKEGFTSSVKAVGDFANNIKDRAINTVKNAPKFFADKVSDIKKSFRNKSTIYIINGGHGTYYDYKGRYYNAIGVRIPEKDITQKELFEKQEASLVTKHKPKSTALAVCGIVTRTFSNVGSNLRKGLTNIGKAMTDAYDNVGKAFDNGVKAVKKFGSNIIKNGIAGVKKLTKKKVTAYYIPNGGGYYLENKDGTFNRYNLFNDLLEENISGKAAEEIHENIDNSLYKPGKIVVNRDLKEIGSVLTSKAAKAWKSAVNAVGDNWKKLTSWLSSGAGTKMNLPDKSGGNGVGIGGNNTGFDNGKIGGAGNQVNNFPYYSQHDSRWANADYSDGKNKGNMGDAGCGPTAMAMVATKYAGNNDTSPMAMAKDAKHAGYRDETGTNANFMSYEAKKLNLSSKTKTSPDARYISDNVGNGKSIILNGISNGDASSAFTKSGHYVVAVGKDSNGNILINDPRGEEYSRAISPKKLAKETRIGWTFSKKANKTGGRGIIRSIREKIGGTGQDWIGCVRSTHKAMSVEGRKHGYKYSQGATHNIKVGGKTYNVRWDCSGFVSACLQVYGVKPKGWTTNSSGFVSTAANISKFKHMNWPGWDKLQEGDIIACDGHVEIFAYNKNGLHYVYNAGSTSAINATKPTVTGHGRQGYTAIWRPNNPGKGVELATDNASSDSSSSSSSSASTNGSNDVLSRVSDLASQYATKATNGMLTGKWDYNFDTNESSSLDSSSSSDDSSDIKGSIKLDGNSNVEKVWNFFTKKGFSPAATAGILGNMYQESGVNPKSIQGNGKGPAAGIFQWENYNTKSSRFGNLYKRANKAGKKWTDLGIQLGYALDEMKSADISNRMSGKYGIIHKGGSNVTDMDGRSYVIKPVNGFDGYKKMTDAAEATKTFEGAFERAGKPNFKRRIDFAKSVMKKYGGKGGDDVPYYMTDSVGGYGTQKTSTVTNVKHVDSSSGGISREVKRIETGNKVTKINDNSNIEQLLSKVYEVLESINTNTANAGIALKNMKQTTVNTQNIVTNGNSASKTAATNVKSSKFQSTLTGRNAALAEKIARG